MTGVIYGLAHAGEVRYVGKTTQPLQERLRDHLSKARRNYSQYVCRWIRSVDHDVVAVVLETDPVGSLEEAEQAWISMLRRYGCRLTNSTDGGEATFGYRHSDETKRKIGQASIGRQFSEEARGKISLANKGKHKPDTQRAKVSLFAKTRQRDEKGRFA